MGYGDQIYGIGKGAAQVWGRNVGLDMLQQAYDQDKKRKEKEDADIQAEIAKINYDGVRQADIPYFTKRYEQVKNLHRQLSSTTNSTERAQLRANLAMEKQKFFAETAQSKQEGQTWGELGKLKFTKPDELSDTFTPDYITGNNLSTFDPAYKPHVEKLTNTMFAPKFDVNKEVKDILDGSVIKSKDIERAGLRKGHVTYNETITGTELDPKLVVARVKSKSAGSPTYRKFLRTQYGDLPEGEREMAHANQIVKEYTEAYKTTKTDKWGEQNDVRPSWSDMYGSYSDRHPKADGSLTPANYQVEYNKNFNYEHKKSVDGKPVTESRVNPKGTFERFVRTDPPAFALPQLSSAYDVMEGKNVKMPANSSVKLTGIGYIQTKSGKPELKATIVDSDGTESIINYVDLPVETRNDKHVKMANQSLLNSRPKASTNNKTNNSSNQTNSVSSGKQKKKISNF